MPLDSSLPPFPTSSSPILPPLPFAAVLLPLRFFPHPLPSHGYQSLYLLPYFHTPSLFLCPPHPIFFQLWLALLPFSLTSIPFAIKFYFKLLLRDTSFSLYFISSFSSVPLLSVSLFLILSPPLSPCASLSSPSPGTRPSRSSSLVEDTRVPSPAALSTE